MRVLFTVVEPERPYCAEIRDVIYKSSTKILRFSTLDDDVVEIPYIEYVDAVQMIRTLYEDGRLDLSSKHAYLNEDAPEYEEPSVPTPEIKKEKKSRGGLFRKKEDGFL